MTTDLQALAEEVEQLRARVDGLADGLAAPPPRNVHAARLNAIEARLSLIELDISGFRADIDDLANLVRLTLDRLAQRDAPRQEP